MILTGCILTDKIYLGNSIFLIFKHALLSLEICVIKKLGYKFRYGRSYTISYEENNIK